MMEIAGLLSSAFMPLIISAILCYGWIRKTPVYDSFIKGCAEGLKTAFSLLPYIIAIFVAIQLLTDSGALAFIEDICAPIVNLAGIPEELISFLILRPVSGSGTLVIIEQLCIQYGPDSYIARAAAVMMGSSETILYAIAVYFSVTSVKRMRHTLPAALIGYAVGISASLVLCRYI